MTFRVGQKVVCVDASGCAHLKNGAVYTVLGISPGGYSHMISVDCTPDVFGNTGYLKTRFRPLVERKTDISVFTRMLNPSKVEA